MPSVIESQHHFSKIAYQVPSVNSFRFELEVIRLSLEVEERHELGAGGHRVRHHALPVDPEEAAAVTRVAPLEN